MKKKIFVYGTLMKGMRNHYYLKDSTYLGVDEIEGYTMYNIGSYPGIVKGSDRIKGEVYEVTQETLDMMDALEGEGYLYLRETINTKYGEAYVYVYNKSIDELIVLPYDMQPYNELVYYVSYGSNMLEERFLSYIKGGKCRFNKMNYRGCDNKSLFLSSKSIVISYQMYYSKFSSSWGGAVSFLGKNKGKTYAKAYLITKEQFEQIKRQEGSWYSHEIELESIDGFETKTFTSEVELEHKSFIYVNDNYKEVLRLGLKESFKNLSDKEIEEYLINCGGR